MLELLIVVVRGLALMLAAIENGFSKVWSCASNWP